MLRSAQHDSMNCALPLRLCGEMGREVKRIYVFVLVLLLVACGPARAQQTPEGLPTTYWGDLPPLQIARQEHGVAAFGGLIYAIAGLPHNTVNNSVEVFRMDTSRWSLAAPLPGPVRDHPAATTAAGRVYVIAGGPIGSPPTDEVWAYNPQADTWEQKASLPIAVWSPAATTLNDRVYVAGGMMWGNITVPNLYRYDPASNQWTQLAPMNQPRNHLALVALNGYVYAVGGRNNTSFTLATLERYDPGANAWTTLPPMPTGRSGHAAAALNGLLVVFGGEGSSQPGGIFPEVEAYDPATNTWTSLPDMSHPRHGFGAATWDTAIYLPGGAPVAGYGESDTFDAFSFAPLTDTWITKTAEPQSALPGQPVTFTLGYGNFGPAIVPQVVVRDRLPSGYAYGGAQPAPTVVGPQLLWLLGTITGTLESMITITGTFHGPTAVNSAVIGGPPGIADRDPLNNQAHVAITPLPTLTPTPGPSPTPTLIRRYLYLPVLLKNP
jgi:uncharacterized repeat protein (TIGR01451 family)